MKIRWVVVQSPLPLVQQLLIVTNALESIFVAGCQTVAVTEMRGRREERKKVGVHNRLLIPDEK